MKDAANPNTIMRDHLVEQVLNVTADTFESLALDIFRYQFSQNQLYQQYCMLLGKDLHNVQETADIPFLPIALFKTHTIHTNAWHPQVVFESSTTTGQRPGRHAVRDLEFYHSVCRRGFSSVLGQEISEYVWIALLPSYAERPGSSLIHMVSDFISRGKPGSTFVSLKDVSEILVEADRSESPVAFIGVSFALLDLVEKQPFELRNTFVIETGGMKGRKVEITRKDLHAKLKSGFHIEQVYSEYGMTELLSQAWSMGDGIFQPAPSLRIVIRELSDPLQLAYESARGGINCIDLANLDSCAFIATDDIGVRYDDDSFEVLGRFDASELRGCNLMVNELIK